MDVPAYIIEPERRRCRIVGVVARAICGMHGLTIEDKGRIIDRLVPLLRDERRRETLQKELREAERHVGETCSEESFAWLSDVREQLKELERRGGG